MELCGFPGAPWSLRGASVELRGASVELKRVNSHVFVQKVIFLTTVRRISFLFGFWHDRRDESEQNVSLYKAFMLTCFKFADKTHGFVELFVFARAAPRIGVDDPQKPQKAS